jgi:hypothetical protein
MRPNKTAHCSVVCDDIMSLRTQRALPPMGASLLILSAGPLFAQIDATQFVARNSSRPQTVSKNQLSAPGKALRAIGALETDDTEDEDN